MIHVEKKIEFHLWECYLLSIQTNFKVANALRYVQFIYNSNSSFFHKKNDLSFLSLKWDNLSILIKILFITDIDVPVW